MIKKVKVRVTTGRKNINLPAIPISLLSFLVQTGIRWGKFTNDFDAEDKELIEQGLAIASDILKHAKPILHELEPFTLVEIESEDANVLIEMR